MKVCKYDVYSIEYDDQGERYSQELGYYDVTETEEIIFLIVEGFLSPEDIAFVESIPTKKGVNVINKDTHALLFRFEKR